MRVARMLRALDEFWIEGPKTLLGFHKALLSHDCFIAGETCHGLVESEELAALASELDGGAASAQPANTSRGRSGADGRPCAHVEVDGRRVEVRLVEPEPPWAELPAAATSAPAQARAGAGRDAVVSPMQGTVLTVAVADGDTVEAGQVICIVEAMKMENEVRAHRAGTVTDLSIAPGQAVASGQTICLIEAARARHRDRRCQGCARARSRRADRAQGRPRLPPRGGIAAPQGRRGRFSLLAIAARELESAADGSLRVPGQGALPARRHPRLGRAARRDARGGTRGGRGARRPRRRQGPGPDRRPRQGRRRQARHRSGGRRGEGPRHPRARHPRPRRPAGLDRDGLRHREGVLPLGHVRPGREAAALHVHDAGRRRDRAGRRGEPGGARPAAHRSARGLPAVGRAPARLRGRCRGPVRAEADRRDHRPAVRGLRPSSTRCSARSTR